MIYILLVTGSIAGFAFMPEAIITGWTIFAILYFINQYIRSNIFTKLAKTKGFSKAGSNFISSRIVSSQLDLFKDSDAKTLRGIYKDMKDYQIILADLRTYFTVQTRQRGSRSVGVSRFIKSNTTTICYLDEKLYLPRVSLYDETIAEKLIAAVGGQDIDFEEDKVFSNRFVLQGSSEMNARDFFTNSMRSFFVQNLPKGFIFESTEDRFILRTQGFANNQEIEALMDLGEKIYQRLRSSMP